VANFINKMFGDRADQSADKTLAFAFMGAAAAGAQAYFTATLQSTTPEVRALLGGFATQKALEHEGLNGYLMQKGYFDPYEDSMRQLMVAEQEAQSVMSQH
jgi:spore coat protein CotF